MADLTPANDVGPVTKVAGAKRRRLRNILLKVSLALTIIGPLVFIIGALGTKIGLWSWKVGLGVLTMKVGPLILVIGAVVALLALIAAIIVKPRKGIVIAIIGLLVPGLAFGKLMQTKSKVAKLPFIHDVTTDTQKPPVFGTVIMAERAAGKDINTADYIGKKAPVTAADGTKSEKLVSALQTKAYPQIRPIVITQSGDEAFDFVLYRTKDMGWEIKDEDRESGRIDATDTTFWYGFKDDITIRLRPSEGGGTIVDVRSLSRVGGSDLGKNAERIERFLTWVAYEGP